MKINKVQVLAIIIVSLFSGCKKGDDKPSGNNYSHGVYIVNEGSFMSNNGSISYYDPTDGKIINGIFEAANQRSVGDVVQSFSVVGDTAGYILVNGSGKVEIVRLKDFRTSAEPIPVVYPRYFLQVTADKGYLTAGSMQGWVYVFDLSDRMITDSILVGFGPEVMVRLENRVFVANSGGWSVDSTISVLDINSNRVASLINVSKVPLDMTLDADNKLWVYCKGYAAYNTVPPYNLISETDAVIEQIDPATGDVLWQQSVGKAGDYTATPPKMAVSKDGERVYYLRPEGVFEIQVRTPAISQVPLITGAYYGIEVNPSDGNIYLFEASFTGNGTMKIYPPAGTLVGEGTVGIAPNGAVFNPE